MLEANDETDSLRSDSGSEGPYRPYQFGLASLLVLTAIVAAILAVLRPLQLPPLGYAVFGGYAILIGIYVSFRGVRLWQRSLQMRRQLDQRRLELQQWVNQRRTTAHKEGSEPNASGTTIDEHPRL